MLYRPLGRSGLEVSALSLGTMNFGSDWLGVGALDEKACRTLVDAALDAGVTLFDTADVYGYGASETMLGKALGKRRQKVLIATKVAAPMRPGDPSSGGLSRRRILEACDDSLRRLGTDVIDLYMPHFPDSAVPPEESFEAFARLVQSGKVRVLGLSNYDSTSLRRWLDFSVMAPAARPQFLQAQYSLGRRHAESGVLPVCAAHEVGFLAWSPLAGGFLTGKFRAPGATGRQERFQGFPPLDVQNTHALFEGLDAAAKREGLTVAQAAIGWVMDRPAVASVILGARTPEQLRETLGARPLSNASKAGLECTTAPSGPR